jgi:hypothetical protein
MRALRLLIIVLALTGIAGRVDAEDAPSPSPEALQAANELFAVLSGDMMKRLSAQMIAAFWPVLEQKARAENIDDATIAELRTEFERIQVAFITDAMKDAPPIYARHFTVPELHELAAFYRSPTGAKALEQMPQVTGEFAALIAPRLKDAQTETNEALTRVLREHGYIK